MNNPNPHYDAWKMQEAWCELQTRIKSTDQTPNKQLSDEQLKALFDGLEISDECRELVALYRAGLIPSEQLRPLKDEGRLANTRMGRQRMDRDSLIAELQWALAEMRKLSDSDAPPYGPTMLNGETTIKLLATGQAICLSRRYIEEIVRQLGAEPTP